jgi:D-alanine-D-alanine ligase
MKMPEENITEKADSEWWKTIFDEVYLTTDARSVLDEVITGQEVDFIEKALGLHKDWPILDLCGGQGRHSLELARRGFRDLTLLDYSRPLLLHGKKQAKREGLDVMFMQNDARNTCLTGQCFKIIIMIAGSFGYFSEDSENEELLHEVFRLLIPNGSFLLDLPDKKHVLNNFVPRSSHKANADIVVYRERSLRKNRVYTLEKVQSVSKGVIREAVYSIRLYSPEEIMAMLKSAGFGSIEINRTPFLHNGNNKEEDRGLMEKRMVVIAHKHP